MMNCPTKNFAGLCPADFQKGVPSQKCKGAEDSPSFAPILPLVIADLEARAAAGIMTYGTLLRPFNGRDALKDAYEEALDLAMYLKQAMIERDLDKGINR